MASLYYKTCPTLDEEKVSNRRSLWCRTFLVLDPLVDIGAFQKPLGLVDAGVSSAEATAYSGARSRSLEQGNTSQPQSLIMMMYELSTYDFLPKAVKSIGRISSTL